MDFENDSWSWTEESTTIEDCAVLCGDVITEGI